MKGKYLIFKLMPIFDRSKVLKEALMFLLLLLAWNQVLKMFQIEQKMWKGTKMC